MAGLAKRSASASVSATKTCRCTPIATPPENSALGCAGPPRFASASLNASILALAVAGGPSVTKCRPRSPAQGDPVVLDEPYQNGGGGGARGGGCSGRSAIGTLS